jgi:hypothetical protein
VADGLNIRYCPCRSIGNTGSVIVSPVGKGNPRLNNTVKLVVVLNTELDRALDELSRARAEIAVLWVEHVGRLHHEDGSPAPTWTQHPYRSPPRGHNAYGTPYCRTKIDQDPYMISVRVCYKFLRHVS